MARESKRTVVKNVISEEEAKAELKHYMADIQEIMSKFHGSEYLTTLSELVWVSKTGDKTRLCDMNTYHIVSAIRALTTKEIAQIVSGQLPGFSVRSLSLFALKAELARRYLAYREKKTLSQGIASWEVDMIKNLIDDIK